MSDHEQPFPPRTWSDSDSTRGREVKVRSDGTPMPPAKGAPRRVLIVSSQLPWIDRTTGLLSTAGIRCVCAATMGMARRREWSRFDAALIDLSLHDGSGLELAAQIAGVGVPVVVVAGEVTLDIATSAAAAGACDLIGRDIANRPLIERVRGAVTRGQTIRGGRGGEDDHGDGLVGLSGLRGNANGPGMDAGAQEAVHFDDQLPVESSGGSAGSDTAVGGHREDPMNQVTVANEFGGLIRHELDIESLLRTTLEFVLAKCGPTNAAVFLPTTSGDYSLGAYVNYDCPKETVDVLLDHLANAVAPRFQDRIGIAVMPDERSLQDAIGDDAGWLDDSGVVAFACRHDREPLAICMLFRDRRSPYPPLLLEQLRTVGELFAAQLARVIRIHHRHLPKDKWGAIGDTDETDESDGYGGGLAA